MKQCISLTVWKKRQQTKDKRDRASCHVIGLPLNFKTSNCTREARPVHVTGCVVRTTKQNMIPLINHSYIKYKAFIGKSNKSLI